MGSRIGKLITEPFVDVESSELEDPWDIEQGTCGTTSSESSNLEQIVDETYQSPQEPYIVEKRFIAGSNECTYHIHKRK